VAINPDEIVHLVPVPTSGPLMGPLTEGTRIVFRNQTHQDVKECPAREDRWRARQCVQSVGESPPIDPGLTSGCEIAVSITKVTP
jgi:hypothetical protein